jgi:hypothetical protein
LYGWLGVAGVEEEDGGFVDFAMADFAAGSLFLPLPLPCLAFFPRRHLSITTHAGASAVPENTGGKTAASAVKTCVAVKNVVGMHVTSSMCACTDHRAPTTSSSTRQNLSFDTRTKRVNNV